LAILISCCKGNKFADNLQIKTQTFFISSFFITDPIPPLNDIPQRYYLSFVLYILGSSTAAMSTCWTSVIVSKKAFYWLLTSAMHHPKTLIEVEQEFLHLTIVNW